MCRAARCASPRRLITLVAALACTLAAGVSTPAVAAAAPMPGLQTHLMWEGVEGAEVDRQLDRAKDARAEVVRVDVGWAQIEQDGKGKYSSWHLARLDGVLDKAQARGIKVLLTFWETPCWASSAPETAKLACAGSWWDRGVTRYAPQNASDYADALAFMVKRYGDRVAAWEIWNEPNDAAYLKAADPARTYADLVKTAYPAAKRAHPGATIIAGSLADSDVAFTEALYGHGIKGSFDAWSIHPYSGDRSPLDLADDAWIKTSFVRGVPAVRELMLRKGDDKPLWLTEMGYSTCTVRGQEKWASCVDEATQATYLREAYRQMRSWDYVKAGIWFNVKDTSRDLGARIDNYGLLRADGSPKPAFAAFQAAASELASGAPAKASTATPPAPTSRRRAGRVRIKVGRRGGSVSARGSAERRTVVRISAFRYSKVRAGFSTRAAYRISVKVGATGRLARRLTRALSRGAWRVTAAQAGDLATVSSSRLR